MNLQSLGSVTSLSILVTYCLCKSRYRFEFCLGLVGNWLSFILKTVAAEEAIMFMDSFFCYLCYLLSMYHRLLECQLVIFDLEESLHNCFILDCADKTRRIVSSCTSLIEGKITCGCLLPCVCSKFWYCFSRLP